MTRHGRKRRASDTIERCGRGDRDALRDLFDAYGARVYSIARHFFGGDEARARDITQDVFVKVMERISGFAGWLVGGLSVDGNAELAITALTFAAYGLLTGAVMARLTRHTINPSARPS